MPRNKDEAASDPPAGDHPELSAALRDLGDGLQAASLYVEVALRGALDDGRNLGKAARQLARAAAAYKRLRRRLLSL